METAQQISLSRQLSEDEEGGLQLGQIFAALRRRVLLIGGIATVVTVGAVLKALTDTPIYQAQFEILTQPVTLETRIISTANPEGLSNQEDLIGSSIDDVKLRILKSPKLLEPALEELQTRHSSLSYKQLFGGLSLSVSPGEILVVRYRSESKDLVEDVLALLSESYIRHSVEDRQSDIIRGVYFVEEQLPTLRERVDFLQESLQDLRRNYNLIDPESQGSRLTERISALEQEQLQINVQLQEATQIYTALRQDVASYGTDAMSSFLQNDQRYQQLLGQLLEIDTEIAQQSVLLLETSPEIQYLLDQRQSLTPIIQQEGQRVQRQVESQIRELSVRNAVLNDAIDTLKLQVKELSSVTRLYTDIQRELSIATTNLNEFLSKREALRIEAAQRQAPWEILTQPSSPKASVSSATQNLVLGLGLGLLVGSGVALVVDKLSSVVHTDRDIKEVIPLPTLGAIPFNQALSDELTTLIGQTQGESLWQTLSYDSEPAAVEVRAFAEAFRSLNANLQLMTPDKKIRSLTISSASPGEGKSTIAINLAQASALMGRKVLLVDADLRHPSLHRKLGLPNEYGLMDVIVSNVPLEDVVQPSVMSPNLFVLTSAGSPPDPPTVFASSAMSSLNQAIQEKFDLVIYDAPPMLGFADAYLTAALSQYLLIVVGLGKVKRSQLQQMVESLKIPDISVLGVVANGTSEEGASSYQYYNYYSPLSEMKAADINTQKNTNPDVLSKLWQRRGRF